jgi:hypothetical protein
MVSVEVGRGTDPTPLSNEVKNKNKLTIFNIFFGFTYKVLLQFVMKCFF